MLGILVSLALTQGGTTPTPDEIKQRFEAPVTMQTDPVRLPIALDQLGQSIGVRIRCDSELQSAVVVVSVNNQPAKKVFKYLLDGIGAGTSVYNGTVQVGMGIDTPEVAEKRHKGALAQLARYAADRGKQSEIDKPFDVAAMTRVGGLALAYVQGVGESYRPPHPDLYQTGPKTPVSRFFARILPLIDPEALLVEEGKRAVLTERNIRDDQHAALQDAYAKFYQEQNQSSAILADLKKLLDRTDRSVYLNRTILDAAEPLRDNKISGFEIEVTANAWSRTANFELNVGDLVFQTQEYLPKSRKYVAPIGEAYPFANASSVQVEYSDLFKRFNQFRSKTDDSAEFKLFDFKMAREVANAWKNEPLAFCRVQGLADVTRKLNMNGVYYLSDAILPSMLYEYQGQNFNLGSSVLQMVQNGNMTSGVRKKDDFLVCYVTDSETYLRNQMDRSALTEFLGYAMKPGPIGAVRMAKFARNQKSIYWTVFRQLANLVRPGFDSLNPMMGEVSEILNALGPGQASALTGNGVPVITLPREVQNRLRGFAMGGRRSPSSYSDTIDSPPSLAEFRRGVLKLEQRFQSGLLCGNGVNEDATAFRPYVYFEFHPFTEFRDFNPATMNINRFMNSTVCWPAAVDSLVLKLEIPRKYPIQLQSIQYDADVSVRPLSNNQILDAIRNGIN